MQKKYYSYNEKKLYYIGLGYGIGQARFLGGSNTIHSKKASNFYKKNKENSSFKNGLNVGSDYVYFDDKHK